MRDGPFLPKPRLVITISSSARSPGWAGRPGGGSGGFPGLPEPSPGVELGIFRLWEAARSPQTVAGSQSPQPEWPSQSFRLQRPLAH